MTRKSKRELERGLDRLRSDDDDRDVEVVWRDQETGDLVDHDGDPVEPDDIDDARCVIINEWVVMDRDRAEVEGRKILGPAETPTEGDYVRVPCDDVDGGDA